MDSLFVLVVDGHPPTRTALHGLLAYRGWNVRCAAGVAEAIRELARPPDCLMLELALPDGDGESILEAVQAKGLSPRTIILSGISDPGRLRAAQERFHPEAAFLKPAPPQALLGVCEQCRHRGSSFKPSRHGAVGK